MGDEQRMFVDNVNGMVQTVQSYKEDNAQTYEDNAFKPNLNHTFIQSVGERPAYPQGAIFEASAPPMGMMGMNIKTVVL